MSSYSEDSVIHHQILSMVSWVEAGHPDKVIITPLCWILAIFTKWIQDFSVLRRFFIQGEKCSLFRKGWNLLLQHNTFLVNLRTFQLTAVFHLVETLSWKPIRTEIRDVNLTAENMWLSWGFAECCSVRTRWSISAQLLQRGGLITCYHQPTVHYQTFWIKTRISLHSHVSTCPKKRVWGGQWLNFAHIT